MHPALSLVLGGVLLVLGAELLVRGASRLALRWGISPLVIGLTVVAFGTSAPEVAASVAAGLEGKPAIALGNIVGSNIANLGLILAIAGLVVPLPVSSVTVRRELPVLAAITIAFAALLALAGGISREAGGALLLGILLYTSAQVRAALRERAEVKGEFSEAVLAKCRPWSPAACAAAVIAGFALLAGGGDLLVHGAVAAARALGVSERVIGLTIVAVGTSLPELATSVVAALKGEPDVAVGNVVGSNVFNILGIGGIVGLISPAAAPPGMASVDVPAVLAMTLLGSLFLATGGRFTRAEGAVMLAGYGGYIAVIARG
jgi:cation:H+ antiporter